MKPLDMFLQDREGTFKKLNHALDQRQRGDVQRLLHTMKGNAQAFGLPALAKYIHTMEWFLQKQDQGLIAEDEVSWDFLTQCCHHLQGAFQVYRADPTNPLTLKEKMTEILQFVRRRLSAGVNSPGSVKINPPATAVAKPVTATHTVLKFISDNQVKQMNCNDIAGLIHHKQISFLSWDPHLVRVGMDLYMIQGDSTGKWLLISKNESNPCFMVEEIIGLEKNAA